MKGKQNEFMHTPKLSLKGEILVYLMYFFLFVGTVLASRSNPYLASVIGVGLGAWYVCRFILRMEDEESWRRFFHLFLYVFIWFVSYVYNLTSKY